MGCAETSVTSNETTLRNMPEERRPALHRGGTWNVSGGVISVPDRNVSGGVISVPDRNGFIRGVAVLRGGSLSEVRHW